jgi:hypothetical protein
MLSRRSFLIQGCISTIGAIWVSSLHRQFAQAIEKTETQTNTLLIQFN